MAIDPSFPMYASDWLGSTRIAMMDVWQERGLFRLLLHLWGTADCSLPDDDTILSRLSLMHERWFDGGGDVVKACLDSYPGKHGFVTNLKLLGLRHERDDWRAKSAAGGRRSGEVRRQAKFERTKREPNQQPHDQPTTQANANTPSPSPSPSPSSSPSPFPSPSASTSTSTSRDGAQAGAADADGDAPENVGPDPGETAPDAIDWHRAVRDAQRWSVAIGLGSFGRIESGDKSLLVKAAALSQVGTAFERLVVDAIEATKAAYAKDHAKRPHVGRGGYLHATLDHKFSEKGQAFETLLARTAPPAGVYELETPSIATVLSVAGSSL